jgi:hypothetical protein
MMDRDLHGPNETNNFSEYYNAKACNGQLPSSILPPIYLDKVESTNLDRRKYKKNIVLYIGNSNLAHFFSLICMALRCTFVLLGVVLVMNGSWPVVLPKKCIIYPNFG